MKNKLSLTTLLAASASLLVSTVHGQLLTSNTLGGFNTNPSYTEGYVLNPGNAATQTFTNVTGVNDFSFRFVANNNSFSASAIDVYLSEWSAGNATTNLLGSGSVGYDAGALWSSDSGLFFFDAAIDLSNFSFNASKLYGLTVVGNTDTAGSFIRLGAGTSAYADGSGFTDTSVATFSDLAAGNASFSGINGDFAFGSAITTAGTQLVASPVPEASTAAVGFAAMFVSMMALNRMRRPRNQLAA